MSQRETTIKDLLLSLNQPAYRHQQILTNIYDQKIFDFNAMSNLPKSLQQSLTLKFGNILTLKSVTKSEGQEAIKVLFKTKDNARLETVMTKKQPFICLSTMSGCNLGCQFCSTGTMGLIKKLTVDEIIDQVLFFEANYGFHGHLTFMGMGEPLLNPEAVYPALKILIGKLHYGQRKISLSTIGIIPEIMPFTAQFPQINLAFSLHTPFDDQRSQLMPINKIYPLAQVMIALTQRLKLTKRKIFLAYLLLQDINDSPEHANALVKLIKSQGRLNYLYHVNLIQFHSYKEAAKFFRSSQEKLTEFSQILFKNHVNFTLRKSFGEDIQAACGQLCLEKSVV